MKLLRISSALIAILATAGSAHAQRYELSGSRVAVYNLVGAIRVEAGSGSSTVVEVEKGGRDANKLEVRTSNINGAQTLVVIYPGDDIVAEDMGRGSQSTMRINADGTFNDGRATRRVRISGRGDRDAIHAHANIIVRLPQGTALDANLAVGNIDANRTAGELDLETASGDVTGTGNRGNVTAESASGNLVIRNVQGDVDAETASGDIEVTTATAQTISAETASGSVTLSDATAQDIDLESASGNIRVTDTRAPKLKAESASGDVRAELDGDVRDVDVSTASGDAEVAVSASFAGEVEMETASGEIDVDFPINIIRKQRNHLRGTIGTGGSARVSLESASGNVRLLRR
jgi:lia operon protein LiaG